MHDNSLSMSSPLKIFNIRNDTPYFPGPAAFFDACVMTQQRLNANRIYQCYL